VRFQDIQNHLFGVVAESLQKLPSKVTSVIAGSFLQPLLLPLFHPEFLKTSRIPNTLKMVLSKSTSTSEVKKLASSLMIEFQLEIFHQCMQLQTLNGHQLIPHHLHREHGG